MGRVVAVVLHNGRQLFETLWQLVVVEEPLQARRQIQLRLRTLTRITLPSGKPAKP